MGKKRLGKVIALINKKQRVSSFNNLETLCFFGGNYRARTYDPLLVRQVLPQLS